MKLILPNNQEKLLLHVCCAPCSAGIIERLLDSGLAVNAFFYNPNISPKEEYEKRKKEVIRFCLKQNVPFIDADYDNSHWTEKINGFEKEPERGKRCEICFKIRLQKTAYYANEHDFPIFATSLSISRWKDIEQVHLAGKLATENTPNILFWDFNWRKNGGQERSREVTQRENFYQQKYCGCAYSR